MPFINRELSWIQFNERVLHLATLEKTPFFEKGRFLHIALNNLDEFYMIRVGSLQSLLKIVESNDNKTHLTIAQQLKLIYKHVGHFLESQAVVYHQWLKEAKEHHIFVKKVADLKANDAAYIQGYFRKSVEPLLSPMVVDQSHPFPFLQSKHVVVVALLKKDKQTKLGLIPLDPHIIPLVLTLPTTTSLTCVMVSDCVQYNVSKIFKGYEIEAMTNMKLIRNADLDFEGIEDDLNFKDVMKKLLKKRQRLGIVSAEFNDNHPQLIKEVMKRITLKTHHVYVHACPLHMAHLKPIEHFCAKRFPEAFYPAVTSYHVVKNKASVMQKLRKQDMLLHVPYDSLDPLIDLLNEAALSPKVVSIKTTLYRLSSHSQIINSLVRAAESGKEVVVLIELKARFDEQHNIDHATTLEEAGCQVIYGFEGYKVHSKCCLITELDQGKLISYTHTSTGNYNEVTAKLYTDVHLLSTNPQLGEDMRTYFRWLQLGDISLFNQELTTLLTSPTTFKAKILHHINHEIASHIQHGNGHIIFKMNSLTDKEIMDALLLADHHGVKIDIICRGINCLSNEGTSIQIRSILGRFLEHPRLYYFRHNNDAIMLLASADLMTRNTMKRIESAVYIQDREILTALIAHLTMQLRDDIAHYYLKNDRYFYREGFDVQMLQFNVPKNPSKPPKATIRMWIEQVAATWFK